MLIREASALINDLLEAFHISVEVLLTVRVSHVDGFTDVATVLLW